MEAEDYFICPRQPGELRLSTGACSKLYQRAKKSEPWDAAHHCKGCAIGARHSGEAPPKQAMPTRECLRCGKQATRLIRNHLCVSCYNREREIQTGNFRRGKPPQNIQLTVIFVLCAGQAAPVRVQATEIAEALMVAIKRNPDVAILGAIPGNPKTLPWSAKCLSPQKSFLPGA